VEVEVLIRDGGGGGGAGGFRESSGAASGCYTASPLGSPTGFTSFSTSYPITVGGGGGVPAPTLTRKMGVIQFFQQ
jgi:hypothetical protein